MPALKEAEKVFILYLLARFDTPSQIVEAVKQEFGTVATRQQVQAYDPNSSAGRNLSPKFRAIFDEERKKFLDDTGLIAISHQSVRLRILDDIVKNANGAAVKMAAVEQAAKEVGGFYTNKRDLTSNGQTLQGVIGYEVVPPLVMANDLAELTPNRMIRLSLHRGQWEAWLSRKRFIAIIAGAQSGKTSFGPHWLYREIQMCGPGDYMVVTPTFALLEKKALPEFLKLFKRWLNLGRYTASPVRKFVFSPEGSIRTFGTYDPEKPTTIFFGYAEDPESLESATAKAVWCDEAGQKKFKLASFEALLRRLALARGRVLITTTPYDLGWLKQQFYDRWHRYKSGAGRPGDEDYDVIRFDSTENPQFSPEEFARAKADLPRWKFDLFYRGIFTRPAGLIYDSFIDDYLPLGHKCPRFEIPRDWPRFLGLDFGGVNTAGCFYAQAKGQEVQVFDFIVKPPDLYYLYRTYKAGGRTAKEHAIELKKSEPRSPFCVGGSHSEDQWRNEFKQGGLVVLEPPIKDVEVGIDRVYGAHKNNQIIVFDDLKEYLEQKLTYSREVDAQGEPTEKIEDKATFHYLDAERYIWAHLKNGRPEGKHAPINPVNALGTWGRR